MEFLRTPTPPYKGQEPNGTRTREPGLLGWIAALFRTPTPEYRTATLSVESDKADTAD